MFRGITLVIAALALVGCNGSTDGRLQITGEVTYDGQPLPDGYLILQPLSGGSFAGAPIKKGKFTVGGKRGPKPGKYQIVIEARRETGKMISTDPDFPEQQEPETEQYLPERYNERSELTEDLSPDNTYFEWNLTSEKPRAN